MLKRGLSVLMVCILVLSVTACGKSKKAEDGVLTKSVVTDFRDGKENKHEMSFEIDGDKITGKMSENGYRAEVTWEYYPDGNCPCRVSSPFLDIESNNVYAAAGVFGNELSNMMYSTDNSGTETSMGNQYVYDYDKKEMTDTYLENGATVKTEITHFEDHGYEVDFVVVQNDGSRGTPSKNRCEYDAAGRVTKITQEGSDEDHTNWIEYSYDGSGNLVKAIRYEDDKKVITEVLNEYDADNRITKKTCKDYVGVTDPVTSTYEYMYGDSGKLTQFTAYGSDGTMMSRTEFIYE